MDIETTYVIAVGALSVLNLVVVVHNVMSAKKIRRLKAELLDAMVFNRNLQRKLAAARGAVVAPSASDSLRELFQSFHPNASPAKEDAWVAERTERGQGPAVREIPVHSYGDPAQAEKLAEFEKSED